jgi:orotidine 5-phosphate decarboxylase, subfamily 1
VAEFLTKPTIDLTMTEHGSSKLIMALDVPTISQAKSLVNQLGNSVNFYKVGLEMLMSNQAFTLIDWLKSENKQVFLDVKLHDIPATVGRAIKQIDKLGVDVVTIHSYNDMIKAAVDAAEHVGILAVTVLTSIDDQAFEQLGHHGKIEDCVLTRAKSAYQLGCAGVIASGHEAKIIRDNTSDNFHIITPGIRPVINNTASAADEQKRIMSVEQAFENGASHIVVGRPIRDAKSPFDMASTIQQQIASV